MADELKNSATDWLETMPEAIQDWLGSAALTYLIMDLNRRLGLDGVKISTIPYLIFRIANKELTPGKLIESLSKELLLDQLRAAAVAKEIEEKMLRPIEVPLRKESGVDIKMIYLGAQLPNRPTSPLNPPVYRPTPSIPIPPPIPPRPVTPPQPAENAPGASDIPVKINVQPAQKPESHSIFDSDSWVNKLK